MSRSEDRRDRRPGTMRVLAMLLALPLLPATTPLAAQIPDTFTNLKVLPEDIGRDSLVSIMRSFALGLGVRCEFCHFRDESRGEGFRAFDFAADSLQPKRTARFMLRMVAMLNDTVLPRLSERGDPPVTVRCVTCHHGQERPRRLEDVLAATITRAGVDSAIAEYRQLRQKTYGMGVYDFGPITLAELARTLLAENEGDAALAMLRLNVEQYPEHAASHEAIGDILARRGDSAGALAAYERALELQPDNRRLRQKLEELKK